MNGLQLTGNSAGSVIRGLAINRFPLSGILLVSGGNSIESNFIGTNAAGTAALGNGGDGIKVRSAGNTIGGTAAGAGNLIAGNLNDGIDISGALSNNLVQGNRIGTNAAGTAAIPNTFQAVFIAGGAANNTIRGPAAGASNLLSGNGAVGDPDPRCRNGRQHCARKLHRHQRHGHGSHPEREQRRDRVERRGEQHDRRHNRRGAQHHLWKHHVRSLPHCRRHDWQYGRRELHRHEPYGYSGHSNGNDGVRIQSPGNTIGGTAAGAGNLIWATSATASS